MSSHGRKQGSKSDRYTSDRKVTEYVKNEHRKPNEKNEPVPTKKSFKTRLYVGNLPTDISEQKFEDLFKNYKIENKHLLKGKGYGFVQLATRDEAEKLRREMDRELKLGKVIHVRYCIPSAALKVRNLGPYVSNELLHQAFSAFGEIDRAVVIADDKGMSTGEGIVEFSSKRAYFAALRACTETCFLINNTLQPVIVEEYHVRDDEGGVPESLLTKHHIALKKDREKPPRIVHPGSFEFEYASRWKKLFDVERIKKEAIEKEMAEAKARLLEDIEAAYYEHQANILREQLKELEEKTSLYQRSKTLQRSSQWEDEQLRLQEEQRRLQDDHLYREGQRLQEEMYRRQQQEEEMRRREMMLKEEENFRLQVVNENLIQPQVVYQGYEDSSRMDVTTERILNNHQPMMRPEMMPHPPPAPNMDKIMNRSRSRDRHRRASPRRLHSKDKGDPHRRGNAERRSRSRRRRR